MSLIYSPAPSPLCLPLKESLGTLETPPTSPLSHFECTETAAVGGTLGALLPHLTLPTSYQQANREGMSVE